MVPEPVTLFTILLGFAQPLKTPRENESELSVRYNQDDLPCPKRSTNAVNFHHDDCKLEKFTYK